MHSLDPVTLEHFHVLDEGVGSKTHYTNWKVTGFKNAIMSDYTENGENVKFTVKFDFIAEGPVRIEILDKDKSLEGNVKYEGGSTNHITFSYTKKKENDFDLYEIGHYNISCESEHAKSTIADDLRTALNNDPDAKSKESDYEKNYKTEHQAKVVCAITKAVFHEYFENLQILGRERNQ
ncbi:uncharacterized protein LOC128671843 isoform X2 [Plodia interpunctella]|nr:uncharacterized protein LOC128671843 isoform X2 [Plodia interpunctella]